MKKILSLFLILNTAVTIKLTAQNCTVTIGGKICEGSIVHADAGGGDVRKLSWSDASGVVTVRAKDGYAPEGVTVAGGVGLVYNPQHFVWPKSFCIDEQGNTYVFDRTYNVVTKWAQGDTAGKIVAGSDPGGHGLNQLYNATSIVIDKSGSLYIADAGNGRIVKWKPGATEGILLAENIYDLDDIYLDDKRNLYVLHNDTVEKWDPDMNTITMVAGGHGMGSGLNQFNEASAVCADKDGNVYVADKYNHRVMKWQPGAVAGSIVAGGNGIGSNADELFQPWDIEIDKKGNLYVADFWNNRIQLWEPGAKYGITVAGGYGDGNTSRQIKYAEGIKLDSDGNIYVLDSYILRVQKFMHTGKMNTEFWTESSTKYMVKAIFGDGCAARSDSIFMNPIPWSGAIAGPIFNICVPDTVKYTAHMAYATSYKWYMPEGLTIISGENTQTIEAAINNFRGGYLKVEGSNSCGTSLNEMQLHRFPDKPNNIQGPYQVQANQQNIHYYVNKPEEHVTYTWQVPEGVTLVSGQGTGSIVVNWGTKPGYFYVYAKNDCGDFHAARIQYIGVISSSAAMSKSNSSNHFSEPDAGMQLYPNPANSILNINFKSNNTLQKTISIFDVHGKKIITKQTTQMQLQLDVNKLSQGVYFIQVEDMNGQKLHSGKFIKQ